MKINKFKAVQSTYNCIVNECEIITTNESGHEN